MMQAASAADAVRESVFVQQDLTESILSFLSPAELLDCACVCSSFSAASDALLTQDGVLELAKSSDDVTDELLLFLAKQRIPRGALKKMDVAGCGSDGATVLRARGHSPLKKTRLGVPRSH